MFTGTYTMPTVYTPKERKTITLLASTRKDVINEYTLYMDIHTLHIPCTQF